MKAQLGILAGGLGTRLRPLTEYVPKSMIMIEDKPFLQYQLELLKKNGITDVVIIVGYLWQQITDFVEDGSKFGLNIRCVFNKYSDALICLYNSRHLFADDFMVMYGDSYLDFNYPNLYNYHLQRAFMSDSITAITMAVCKNYNSRYMNNVVLYKGGNSKIYYSKLGFENVSLIDYGISVWSKHLLDQFKSGIESEQLTLPELYRVVSSAYMMDGVYIPDHFYEIGTPESLEEFKRFIHDRNEDSV